MHVQQGDLTGRVERNPCTLTTNTQTGRHHELQARERPVYPKGLRAYSSHYNTNPGRCWATAEIVFIWDGMRRNPTRPEHVRTVLQLVGDRGWLYGRRGHFSGLLFQRLRVSRTSVRQRCSPVSRVLLTLSFRDRHSQGSMELFVSLAF